MMLRVGFTGSREIVESTANDLIGRILAKCSQMSPDGLIVHVGDAHGVDAMVVGHCMPRFPMVIYGVNGTFRNFDTTQWAGVTFDVLLHSVSNKDWAAGYLERNRLLVDGIDVLYAVWNGQSSGTKYTYDYAVKMGKKAHLFVVSEEGYQVGELSR